MKVALPSMDGSATILLPNFSGWARPLTYTTTMVRTPIGARDVEVTASGLVGCAVSRVLIGHLVEATGAEGPGNGVAGYAVGREVRHLGYLVRVLGLRDVGHEARVLAVEVDEYKDS